MKIWIILGLIALIYYESKRPITATGETKLYHGPVVDARWQEKQNKQGCLTALWIFLIMAVVSLLID